MTQIALESSFLHVIDRFLDGHDVGKSEERGLKCRVGALAHADGCSDIDSIDGIELDIIPGNVALCLSVKMLAKFLRRPLAVDHEYAARLYVIDHLVSFGHIRRVVAGYEVSLVDVVWALDRMIAEAQVGDRHAACLLGVILEVSLYVLVGVVSDDLDGVLVRADCSVAAKAPELALDRAFRSCVGSGFLFQ